MIRRCISYRPALNSSRQRKPDLCSRQLYVQRPTSAGPLVGGGREAERFDDPRERLGRAPRQGCGALVSRAFDNRNARVATASHSQAELGLPVTRPLAWPAPHQARAPPPLRLRGRTCREKVSSEGQSRRSRAPPHTQYLGGGQPRPETRDYVGSTQRRSDPMARKYPVRLEFAEGFE